MSPSRKCSGRIWTHVHHGADATGNDDVFCLGVQCRETESGHNGARVASQFEVAGERMEIHHIPLHEVAVTVTGTGVHLNPLSTRSLDNGDV